MTKTSQDGTVLDRLFAVVESRLGDDPEQSYTARLLSQGRGKICAKLGEEAMETAVAALDETPGHVVRESADLLYHLLVLWADTGVVPAQVWEELARRKGVSGLEEKASRET